ncbi:hypothetical protein CEY16_14115 [Halalkalibacillus sediminis]|uniref:Type 4 fimbrial biogenesis protein PilX N-terminal domain-containing protein n=1 Tax=Halalkalibacillus sediminis TaxID=2018042 RepID=A0A2I0QRH0_9BACI|nr:hypothetical protein [Halalkalibacillus sediminis]PKR76937.1 hypothetical protein CEY16_14115 [Halalkalibacillus sediminis]
MRNRVHNQQGAALVVVLMTIALIMIFTTVMMNSILSSAKQNQIIESNYRSTHLAEMGARYIHHNILIYVKENDYDHPQDLSNMQQFVENKISSVTVDENHEDRTFELIGDISSEDNGDSIRILYTVAGHDGDFTEELNITLSLDLGDGSVGSSDEWDEVSETFPDPPENPDHTFDEQQDWSKKDCPTDENGSYYLDQGGTVDKCDMTTGDFYSNGDLVIEGNDKSSLTINGTGVFQGVGINNKTNLQINGNAFINAKLTSQNNPNSQYLSCGSSRFKGGIDYRGEFSVKMYMISDGFARFESNPALIGEDAVFKQGLELKNTYVRTGGDLTIHISESVDDFLNGVNLYVGGDLTLIEHNDNTTINPNHSNVTYITEAQYPEFPACEGVEIPSSGGGSDPSADLVDGQY